MAKVELSERDLQLIAVALESAASACGSIFGSDDTKDLRDEYLEALTRVEAALDSD